MGSQFLYRLLRQEQLFQLLLVEVVKDLDLAVAVDLWVLILNLEQILTLIIVLLCVVELEGRIMMLHKGVGKVVVPEI
tara:strand:- start:362 stop:595 length:234 start_codon:yes stop_codon:yes gene_type:complete